MPDKKSYGNELFSSIDKKRDRIIFYRNILYYHEMHDKIKFTQYWCCFQKSTRNDFIEDECHAFKYNPFSLEKSVNTPDNKRKPTLKIDTLETVENTPIESRKFTITDSPTVITESIYGKFITPPTPPTTPESIPAVIGFIPKHLTKNIEILNKKILMEEMLNEREIIELFNKK